MSTASATATETREPLLASPDVRAFCERHQLAAAVAETARLLRETFPAAIGIEVALRHDPEASGVSWVSVAARVSGRAADLARAYDDFLDRWVASTPAPVRDRITPTFAAA